MPAFRASCAVTILLLAGTPPSAKAQQSDALQDGLEAFRRANPEAAIRAFDRAESEASLTRADVVKLYAYRALVHHARGDTSSAETDLRGLFAIAPGHQLPPEASPDFRDWAKRVRASVPRDWLSARAHRVGSTVEMAVSVDPEIPPGIAREVRLKSRVDGGPWTTHAGPRVSVELGPTQSLTCFAEALGPGDATLQSTEPVHVAAVAGDDPFAGHLQVDRDDSEETRWALWLALGGVAVVGAAVAVTLALALPGGSDKTSLMGPDLGEPMP